MDPSSTYVLDETAITKAKSLDELAELALSQAEERDSEASSKAKHEDAFDWDEL